MEALTDFHLRTDIRITATPATVWAKLTDFGGWPAWNPFLTRFEGEAIVGNTVGITAGGSDFRPEILVVDPERELRWIGKIFSGKIFAGEHYFLLEPQPDGSTLLVHGEHFSGWLLPLLKGKLSRDTKRGFKAMNLAIKTRCEVADPAV